MKKSISLALLLLIASCATHQAGRNISSTEVPAKVDCGPKVVSGKSDLRTCHFSSAGIQKTFYLFNGKGTPQEIQYAHGFLLAEQVENGSIQEMLGNLSEVEAKFGKFAWIVQSILGCQMKRLKKSVTPEFLQSISAMAQGYADGMRAKGLTPKYTEDDFMVALLGVESGNVFYGIALETKVKPLNALRKVVGQCGLKIAGDGLKRVLRIAKKHSANDRKMGCVGVVAPDSATGNGLIHGRNLDQSPLLHSWAKFPVVYLIHEDGKIPYVASGTAGLIYPGGISGFNEHGISVSLHQMNTTRWDSKYKKGSAEVLPNLQQRILSETKSIDEAIALVKKTNVISSWTIFISDSKNQEVASIEVSANEKVVARRKVNESMAQSNHYISPKMQRDHVFTHFSSYIETQSRLYQMEKLLAQDHGKIDLDWVISALSSHDDFFEGEMGFGRTAVKLSNLMATVAYPARQEFWMTIGDRHPAAHGWYVGTKVDFKALSLDVISVNRTHRFDAKPNFEKSFSYVISSYNAYRADDFKKSISELEVALKLARLDGANDSAYVYNLSRLHMHEEDYAAARGYMDQLLPRKDSFHPYFRALISMFSARMRQMSEKGLSDESKTLYAEAKTIFAQILKDSEKNKTSQTPDPATPQFEEARFKHGSRDLRAKLKLIKAWEKGKDKKIPSIDYTVLE